MNQGAWLFKWLLPVFLEMDTIHAGCLWEEKLGVYLLGWEGELLSFT